MADQVGGPDDGHEPNAVRRNVGYVVTGWRIIRLRRRARLRWYGRWRNYLLPALLGVVAGVVGNVLASVTAGSAAAVVAYGVALRSATGPTIPRSGSAPMIGPLPSPAATPTPSPG